MVVPGISDHEGIPVVTINIKPKITKFKPRKIFMYHKADHDQIKRDLTSMKQDFESLDIDHLTVDQLWAKFSDEIKQTMDDNIPSKIVRGGKVSPWINHKIKRKQKQKQRAYNHAKNSQDPDDWDKFRSIRRNVTRETRHEYRKYIKEVCFQGNKKFWSFVKSLKKDSAGIPALKDENFTLVTENIRKAGLLNKQFESVFTQENLDHFPTIDKTSFPCMPDIHVNASGVEKLLSKLNIHKATGPDEIPSRILKEYASEIAPTLTIIFNKSLASGILPESWRQANISPIFKKGERTKPSNYRPVSLTSVSCKVLEHILHSNIMSHLDSFNILTDWQHGFRTKHSCNTQLIQTVHDFAQSLDLRKQTDVIIMDFSKAFDVVPHKRLLLKLKHFGIQNNTHRWITNFLTQRHQRVVVGGDHSEWVPVRSGVSQGTVLGPLLFLLFLNDLPENLSSQVRLFADDCVVYREIVNDYDAEMLQKDLDTLSNWEKTWQMHFNADKCFVLKITHAHKHIFTHSYKLGGSILQETDSHPYLGVEITKDLKWKTHINQISAKGNRALGFIKRNL